MSGDQGTPYDDSPWTPTETGLLASEAFSKLDDADYSDYLGDERECPLPEPGQVSP